MSKGNRASPRGRPKHKRLMLSVAVASVAVVLASAWTVHSRVGDSGPTSWQLVGLKRQFVHSLAFSQAKNVMLAGTETGVYIRRPSGSWTLTLPRQEIWSVALSTDGSTALAATNSGTVSVSGNGGSTWRRHVEVSSGGMYAVSFRPGASHWMLAGGAGGIFLSQNGGRTWRQQSFIGKNAVDSLAWQPGSNQTAYAGVVSGGTNGVSSVLATRDGGRTWTRYSRGLTESGAMSVLATPRSILAGTMGHAVWRIPHRGTRWNQVRHGLPPVGDHVASLIASTRGRTLFAGTEGFGVFVSSDDGHSWTSRSQGLPSLSGQKIVLGLVYVPTRHRLYAGTPSGIYSLNID